jgi:2-polyprenyl-6-methoxyphenol hydroxylase-like FAD-dependent oxidoreductase
MTVERIEGRAIVVGAGIAGLLAGRVLSDWYDEVTILDRDTLPIQAMPRRGVPQDSHAHALLARGQQVLEKRFPGLTQELAADGAAVGDPLDDVRMILGGHRFSSAPTGLIALSASRPFLERHIRQRVEELPGVSIRDGVDVVGLTTCDQRLRVTGVRLVARRDGSAEEALEGEAVVVASGSGSRLVAWLAALGIDAPPQERVEIGLAYASRRIRLGRADLGGDLAIIEGMTPTSPRGGVVAALERGTGIVTLAGLGPDRPPTDPDGFVEFARRLGHTDIHDVISRAEPIDDPVPYRFHASTRLHVERQRDLPAGLACVGDAFCRLNPVYGQGMTLAALAAEVLASQLRRHRRLSPRRVHRRIGRAVTPAWAMVVGSDLALPTATGTPSTAQRLVGRYVRRLHAGAAIDPVLAVSFTRVSGLVDPPQSLLHPAVLRRVLWAPRSSPPDGDGCVHGRTGQVRVKHEAGLRGSEAAADLLRSRSDPGAAGR